MGLTTATLCILISLCVPALWAQNVTFRIRFLNGKTGNPIAQQRLLLFGGATPDELKSHKINMELTSNSAGLVSVTTSINTFRLFQVWPDFMMRCAPQVETFTTETILQTGAASPNTCRKNMTGQPRPGELTFYVRQPTLREKMNW